VERSRRQNVWSVLGRVVVNLLDEFIAGGLAVDLGAQSDSVDADQ